MKRRGLLAAVVAGAGAALATRRVRAAPSPERLRPPGALPEADFQRACIRCFRCAEVCPTKAIRFDSVLDLGATDTPFLDARQAACVLCMRCTQVCPTEALVPIAPEPEAISRAVKMGTPVLERSRCLAWTGQGVCRLCYYVCPYPERAVEVVGPQQAPLFHPEACVGCGLCEEACPERARAIHIVPAGTEAERAPAPVRPSRRRPR